MSILETFYLLFKTNTDDLKKGADDVEKSTGKMDVALEKTGTRSEFLEHIFHHLRRELLNFTVSMIGLSAALEGIRGTVEYFNKLSEASELLHVNVGELNAWNEAVTKAGGSADVFDESLKKVAEHFHTTNAVALKVLPQFASLFEHLNKTQSLEYGKKIGLDEPTIQLLQRGRHEVEAIIARQKELGVITEEQKDTLKKFNDAWKDTKQQLRLVTFEAELELLPALTKIIKFLGETINYFEKHPDFVKSFLISFAAMTVAVKFFGKTVEKEGKNAALGWAALLGPIGAVSAAIALVIDDWMAFKRGDESVTGEVLKRWPLIGKAIVAVGNEISAAVADWIAKFKMLLELIGKLNSFIHKTTPKDYITSAYDPRVIGIDSKTNNVELAKSHIAFASSTLPIGYGILRNPQNKNTNISIGDITINTNATDANGIALEIGKTLPDHFFQLQSNVDDGRVI